MENETKLVLESYPEFSKPGKRLRIFKSPWHLAHDFRLIKALSEVADFDLLINYTRRWDERVRKMPENAKWVTSFEPGKYDLAILNIDQQCTQPGLNKGILIKHMKQAIQEIDPKCKIIFINHGTPVYPELYQDANKQTEYVSEVLKKEILDVVGDSPMVVNSFQAAEDWGRGTPIIHGMDPEDWKPRYPKEPRAVCFISAGGMGDKYYNRSFLSAVIDELRERYGLRLHWINAEGHWTAKDIKDYKEFVGSSLVYFNPTFGSPMPSSRTEAMFMGCCIVTTKQHGADRFIKEGYNGFFVPHNNVDYAAKLINYLVTDGYKEALEMGKNARETAIKEFSVERYKNDWIKFLRDNNIL